MDEVDVPRAVEMGIIENALQLVPARLHARLLNDHDPRDVVEHFQHGVSIADGATPVNDLRGNRLAAGVRQAGAAGSWGCWLVSRL